MSNTIPINILVGLIGANGVHSGLASITQGLAGMNNEAMRAPAGASALGRLTSIAGAAIAALGAVKEALDVSADLTGLSDRIEQSQVRASLAGEAYQALGFHIRQAGGDAGELVGALEFLRRMLGEASNAGSQQAETLTKVGLRYRDLASLPIEQRFERVAIALAKVRDENIRAALTAELLGRGSASLNNLIDQLASRGLGALSSEARQAAGVLSNETAAAIDEAGDRASAANEKFSKLFADVVLSAQRSKAAIAELKVELAQSVAGIASNWSSIAASTAAVSAGIIAGRSVLAASASTAAAAVGGGLGMRAAIWAAQAEIAASTFAVSLAASLKTALSSVWVVGGALVAAAVIAGLGINRAGASAATARDTQTASEGSEDDTRRGLAARLNAARDQATVSQVSQRAAVLSRIYRADSAAASDEKERERLDGIAREYSLIVARAREQGTSIVAANQALDAQNKAKDAAATQLEKAKQTSAELAKQAKAYQEAADKARYAGAKDEEKLVLLDQQVLKGYQQYQTDLKAAELAGDENAKVAARAKWDATRLEIANERDSTEKRILDGKKRQLDLEEEAAKAAERAAEAARQKAAIEKRDALEDKQRGIQRELSKLDGDFARTDAEKWSERREILERAAAAARDYASAMKAERDKHPEDAQAQANYRSADQGLIQAEGALANLGADPNSYFDQMRAGLAQLRSEWGTTAQNMAQAMVGAISSAQSATSNFLFDGLAGAKSWSDAWDAATLQVGQQFLRMATDQVSKLLWKNSVERVLVAAGVATHTAGEAAKTTATATGTASRLGMIVKEALASVYKGAVQAFEALSSIPYVGPILGAAAMAAALAGGIALVSKIAGHAEGGFHNGPGWVSGPGTATSDSINARLSDGEYVVPVWQTKHPVWGPMIAALEAGRRGQTPGFASGGLFGSLKNAFIYGGVPKWALDPKLRSAMEDYNLVNGRKIYGYSEPADDVEAFTSASAAEAATPAPSSGSFSQADIEGMVRRESARNIHLHLSERGWREAIRDDVTAISREVFFEEQRKG